MPTEVAAARALTPAEAARALGVHLNFIYNLLQSGKLSGHKDAKGRWSIPAEAVAERKKLRQRKRA